MRTICLPAFVVMMLGAPFDGRADEPAPIRVMTFNIRYNNPGDGENAWPHRREWVARIIRENKADVAGLQEALAGQIADLEKLLPEYAWYGLGRDDGKRGGEFVPVFFRRDRIELLEKATFWLSKTPETPGSRGWDASLPRTVTFVRLKDRRTGRRVSVFNTHYDHRGTEARRESSRLILSRIAKLRGGDPAVLTGDFNCLDSSRPYRILTTGDEPGKADRGLLLRDARTASETRPAGPDSTWNGFERIEPGRRIDFIFVTEGFQVRSHRILDEQKNGRFPSDHLPVLAELGLEVNKP